MIGKISDARPLDGRCVLVTRPRAQAAELIALLESSGARVVVAPTVRIVPPTDPVPLLSAAANLARFDWLVFSSANAVDALFDAIPGDATIPTLPKIAAVGTRTAERLSSRGYEAAVVPDEFTAEGLVRTLTSRTNLAGARVLIPRSEIGRDVIAEGLRGIGAIVTDVIAYRTIAEQDGDEAGIVRTLLTDGALDAVTFTSGSAVRNFVQLYGPDVVDLLRHTVVAVIGPVTADAARELGLAVQVQPTTYTAAAMVETLSGHFHPAG